VICIVNFGDQALPMPAGTVLMTSLEGIESELPRDAAAWLLPT
jgi:hypothetical protein